MTSAKRLIAGAHVVVLATLFTWFIPGVGEFYTIYRQPITGEKIGCSTTACSPLVIK